MHCTDTTKFSAVGHSRLSYSDFKMWAPSAVLDFTIGGFRSFRGPIVHPHPKFNKI